MVSTIAVPELVSVTICTLLVAPTPVVGKLNCAGCACTVPARPPAPLKSTAAEFNVLELTFSVPATVPLATGVNTTPTEQLAPTARRVPQVFCVRLKGAVVTSVSPLAATVPEFVTVTVCAGLGWPMVAATNVICAGLTLSPEAAVPVPLNPTEAAFTPSVEEVTVNVAVFPPTAAGVKITCTVQLPPLFSVAPHVVDPVEKLPADRPVI